MPEQLRLNITRLTKGWSLEVWPWDSGYHISVGNVRRRKRNYLASRVLCLTGASWRRLFRESGRLGMPYLFPRHCGLDSAKIHGLGSQGYCFEFLQWILYQNQKLKGWLTIVQKFVLMQCFEHLFLKHVLQICSRSLLKAFDSKDHFENLECIVL